MESSDSVDPSLRPEGRTAVDLLRNIAALPPSDPAERQQLAQQRAYARAWVLERGRCETRRRIAYHMYEERARAAIGLTPRPVYLPRRETTERDLAQLERDGWSVECDSHWLLPEWLWPGGVIVRDPACLHASTTSQFAVDEGVCASQDTAPVVLH